MVEPVSVLGGVALGVAKDAITKWVGGRIAENVGLALRNRQLRQGRPSKDQQTELVQVIQGAVELTAAELHDGDLARQRKFTRRVCRGGKRDWPLVDGSDLKTLVSDVAAWLAEVDPRFTEDGAPFDAGSHPYLGLLCEHVVAQFGFRAENNGMRNTILFPRWNRFCRDELFPRPAGPQQLPGSEAGPAAPQQPPESEPGPTASEPLISGPGPAAPSLPREPDSEPVGARQRGRFDNAFHGPVTTVVQGDRVTVNVGTGNDPVPPGSYPGSTTAMSPWPRRFGTVPPLAVAHLDRPIDGELAEALTDGGTVVCQILAGGGGVGKTQIAAAYAHRRWGERDMDLLVWVNAATRDAIIAAFAEVGAEYCGAVETDGERAAERFLAWLDRPEAPRWLIVLDDLTDVSDLHGLWPPASPTGRAIVTTRLRESALDGHGRIRVDVGYYTPEQAGRFLTERLGKHPDRLDGAEELAEALGCLPLGLGQAAAYLLDRPGLTCRRYVELLADHERPLSDLAPGSFSEDYPRSLAAALALSIDRAAEHEPQGLASTLLGLGSLLDPAGIPAALFTTEPVRQCFTGNTDTGSEGKHRKREPLPPRVVEDALARLHQLNLIDHDGTLIRIHALTQRACLDRISPDQRETVARIDADALVDLWPEVESNSTYSALLRANTAHLRSLAEPALLRREAHGVLFLQGKSLGETGLVHEATMHIRILVQLLDSNLGPDHHDTLTARNNLAVWRGEAGDAAGAVIDFQNLLNDRLRILGPDHPDTLTTRGNLARWRGKAGNLAGAAIDFQNLLEDFLRILGPDHPHTLTTRNNLALWRGEAGDIAGAVTDFQNLLNDRLRILGPDHPDTLTTRNNLATWRGEAGDIAGAATDFQALLEDQLRVLGPDHPDTFTTRNNLAHYRGEAGDPAGAVTDFESLLEDFLRVLGPDHPDALTTRNNLALWRGEAGDMAGAVTDFESLLEDFLRILGPDHPDALTTRNNLATWRGKAGDAAGAATDFQALLEDFLRILGPDHPHTLTARSNLTSCQGMAGDPAGAVADFQTLLDDRMRILGPDHPDTLTTRSNLAYWEEVAGSGS